MAGFATPGMPHVTKPTLVQDYLTLLAEVALIAVAISVTYVLHLVLLLVFGGSERWMLLLILESIAVVAAAAGVAAYFRRRWAHLDGFTLTRLSRATWFLLVFTMAFVAITGTAGAFLGTHEGRWFICVGMLASSFWAGHPPTRAPLTIGTFGFLLLLLIGKLETG